MVTASIRQIETLQTLLDTVDPVEDAAAGDKITAIAVALRDAMARVAPAIEAALEAESDNRLAF